MIERRKDGSLHVTFETSELVHFSACDLSTGREITREEWEARVAAAPAFVRLQQS